MCQGNPTERLKGAQQEAHLDQQVVKLLEHQLPEGRPGVWRQLVAPVQPPAGQQAVGVGVAPLLLVEAPSASTPLLLCNSKHAAALSQTARSGSSPRIRDLVRPQPGVEVGVEEGQHLQ